MSSEPPPGYFPPDSAPVIRPPWAKETTELPSDVIDTRTQVVGRGATQRDPDEPAFFPGRAPKHADAKWHLMLADGRRVSVKEPIVVGRKPDAVDGYPGAKLVSVEDPGKTVSKSHAVVVPYGEGLYVIDLGSTNGVAVVADGGRRAVSTTEFTAAPDGSVIELGSYLLGVEKDG